MRKESKEERSPNRVSSNLILINTEVKADGP